MWLEQLHKQTEGEVVNDLDSYRVFRIQRNAEYILKSFKSRAEVQKIQLWFRWYGSMVSRKYTGHQDHYSGYSPNRPLNRKVLPLHNDTIHQGWSSLKTWSLWWVCVQVFAFKKMSWHSFKHDWFMLKGMRLSGMYAAHSLRQIMACMLVTIYTQTEMGRYSILANNKMDIS